MPGGATAPSGIIYIFPLDPPRFSGRIYIVHLKSHRRRSHSHEGEVETITATIAGETYELRADGNSGYILSHTEVSPFVEDNHIDLSCIKLYNASGTDITANYSLHGGI